MPLFLIVFFLLFGFKISFVDLSVLIPTIILLFYVVNDKKIFLNSFFIRQIVFFIFVLCYAITIQLINDNLDMITLARYIRCVITIIIICFLLSTISNVNKIIRNIFYALLIHSVIIILSASFLTIGEYLSFINGNDKYRLFRSSGLLSGFDFAGFGAIIGIIMTGMIGIKSKFITILIYFIFLMSTLLSSRMSMGVALVIVFIYSFNYIRRSNFSILFKGSLASILLIITFPPSLFILDLLLVSIGDNPLYFDSVFAELSTIYNVSQSGEDKLWTRMFFLPNSDLEILFGSGSEPLFPLNSDVGYVKDLFRLGFIGLIVVYGYHFLSAINVSHDKDKQVFIYTFLILMVVLSLKNNYFLTRFTFPLFWLMLNSIYILNLKSGPNCFGCTNIRNKS